MNRTVLVTGGTGYIGSHTVVELLQKNHPVIMVDNLVNSSREVVDRIEKITGKRPVFRELDLCDRAGLRTLFENHPDINAVIHFAALKAVGESVEKPLEYYHNNLESIISLLEVMKEFSTRKLVFSSSCTVYGQPDHLPVTETSPLLPPNSPYANTKKICEEIIRDAIGSGTDLNAISLRYFNPVGAHPSSLIGELPPGVPQNLVPYLTQTAAGIRKELRVYGNDYNTPDGTGVRDYIYVVDLAKAHVKAIERLTDNKNSQRYEVFNLGTGNGISVMEIIQTFEKATGVPLNYKIHPRRPGDIECIYADTSLANRELDWYAGTPLEEILRTAWKWEKAVRNLD